MKLEYLSEGSADCPLIRIYDFNTSEARELHDVLIDLAKGKMIQVVLQDLPFIVSVQGCSLTLSANETNIGISLSSDLDFECQLTNESWMVVADLAAPFLNDTNGYQWLDETGKISLLLSPSGRW